MNERTTPSMYSVIFPFEGASNIFLIFRLIMSTIKNQKIAQNNEKL